MAVFKENFLFIRWMELLGHAIKAEEIDEELLGRPHSDTLEQRNNVNILQNYKSEKCNIIWSRNVGNLKTR